LIVAVGQMGLSVFSPTAMSLQPRKLRFLPGEQTVDLVALHGRSVTTPKRPMTIFVNLHSAQRQKSV
jgi:hypothetical protein